MKIDWDLAKANANLLDHGIGFSEAATVLMDDQALTREDPDSVGEQRFVTLGMSATGTLLVVVFTHREPDVYRIISAWKAHKRQRTNMKKLAAEPYRDIDFSKAKRGAVIPSGPGKVKLSIRLDNAVVDYFRGQVKANGAGSYQTLINDALAAYIQQRSMLDAVRQVVREELTPAKSKAATRGRAVAV